MNTLDAINLRYCDGTLKLAVEALGQRWQMRREWGGPRYTTWFNQFLC